MVRLCNERKTDVDQILELYKQAGWSDGAQAGCAVGIGDKQPGEYLLVNEIDGKIVATAQLNIIPSYAHLGTPYAIVNYVVTDKNERRKGYMAEVFNRIEEICTEHSCSSILLDSAEWRKEAHQFYESMGYESMRGFRKRRK